MKRLKLLMMMVAVTALAMLALSSFASQQKSNCKTKNIAAIDQTKDQVTAVAKDAAGTDFTANYDPVEMTDQLKLAVINKPLQMEPQTVGTKPDTAATANYNYEKTTPTVGGTSPANQEKNKYLYESSIAAIYGNPRSFTAGVMRR